MPGTRPKGACREPSVPLEKTSTRVFTDPIAQQLLGAVLTSRPSFFRQSAIQRHCNTAFPHTSTTCHVPSPRNLGLPRTLWARSPRRSLVRGPGSTNGGNTSKNRRGLRVMSVKSERDPIPMPLRVTCVPPDVAGAKQADLLWHDVVRREGGRP